MFSGFGYGFSLILAFFLFTSVLMGGGEGNPSAIDQVFWIAWIAFIGLSFWLARFRPPVGTRIGWLILFGCYISVALLLASHFFL
jgi:hypothetical protein